MRQKREWAMKIDGRCHCGLVTYQAEIDSELVAICHCTDCQTLSGTAFRTVVPSIAGSFKLLSGAPKIYLKTAESGVERALAFCPECGTQLWEPARATGRSVTACGSAPSFNATN
jgi:hypothetical protein